MRRILNWLKGLFRGEDKNLNKNPEITVEDEISDSMSMIDAYREYKRKCNQNAD